jgi:hypothetical protein
MDDQALDVRVEGLARELARTINGGAAEGREHLRELAIELIREEVRVGAAPIPDATPAIGHRGTFNPFGVAIPLFLTGGLLMILFPPVGVLLFMAAIFMMGWGLIATLLTRR